MKNILPFLAFLLFCSQGFGQSKVLYKVVDSTSLYLHHYPSVKIEKPSPAMVFFFGGGWNSGNVDQFKKHAEYFSQRGISCFLAEYRVKNFHGTSPFESLKDANSAIRYIRENATNLNIDPNKIIASGGSAGGHLAAATAFSGGFNELGDNLSISSVPNALVLFNPVIDNGPGGYGYERIGESYDKFSPIHNIRAGAPPTVFFLGDIDKLIPVATAEYYATVMHKIGAKCELHIYKDAEHGFFNYKNFDWYKDTIQKTDHFLQELGYLSEFPKIEIK